MSGQELVSTIGKLGRVEKWLRITIVATFMSSIALLGFGAPVSASGATQISGIGYYAEPGECIDSEGAGSDFAVNMTGDLSGCLYVFVETFETSPSGTYRERGTEIYVGEGGTFSTTYLFTAKFDAAGEEIFGRCQHPIMAGSGTGYYEGVTGRLDLKDDIGEAEITFPYRGHLQW